MLFYRMIASSPHSPLAVGLSFFPLTASITLSIRQTVDTVPKTQVILSVIVLALNAVLTIWLAGFVWQKGMLNYGRRLNWRQILGKTKQKRGEE
jgi:ABC-2 type transport system permease protein